MSGSTPKAFISYSWTSDDHVAWVENLATRLRADGVDVIFDRWDLKRGHDKYAFMEKMVTDPDVKKVLAVSDSRYAAKADGREGGVGTESQIISHQLYTKTNQEKFIPCLRERDDDGEPYLPTFFKHIVYFDFSDDARFEDVYDDLIRDIFDAPAKRKPPLGKPPAYITTPGAIHLRTTGAFARLKNAVENHKAHVAPLFDQYLDTFIEALEDFRIRLSEENRPTFDDEVVATIEQHTPYREEFIRCAQMMMQFAPGSQTVDSLISFIERLMAFDSTPGNVSSYNEIDNDNYRFMMYELFLHVTAMCIRIKAFDPISKVVDYRS